MTKNPTATSTISPPITIPTTSPTSSPLGNPPSRGEGGGGGDNPVVGAGGGELEGTSGEAETGGELTLVVSDEVEGDGASEDIASDR